MDTQISYDRVADEYVLRISDELKDKPLDRQLLDRFAENVRNRGGVACDIGCGPGHVARYLREHGVNVCGVDISTEMVERARRLTRGVEFRQGDMQERLQKESSNRAVEATVLWVGMEVPPDVRRANSPNKISTGRLKPPCLDGRRFFVCPGVLDVLKEGLANQDVQ